MSGGLARRLNRFPEADLDRQPRPLFPDTLGIERGKRESLQLSTALMRAGAYAIARRRQELSMEISTN